MELKKQNKGIIFAADIVDKNRLLRTIEKVVNYISGIKIGNTVLYQHGWPILKEIKNVVDLPIIADLKLMDIPKIASEQTSSAIKAGADGVMVCGVTGVDTLNACCEAIDEKMLFVFTQFTHESGIISDELADKCLSLATEIGCYGVQVPGTRPDRIKEVRERLGGDIVIITCGVGAQGPEYGSAISAGANYEIIGRLIYNSVNPDIIAESIYDKINSI